MNRFTCNDNDISPMNAYLRAFYISSTCLLLLSCVGQTNNRVISSIPINDEIMGLKLGAKSSENDIQKMISQATGDSFFLSNSKLGPGISVRAISTDFDFSFGGFSWSYADFLLNEESVLYELSFIRSYENIERAKEQFEQIIATLTQKYGRSNRPNESTAFWTDDTVSVGTMYEEASAIDGNDRCFCHLYYVNISLTERARDAATSDL